MNKVFEVERLVRHGHTDPAGIVYYPRYYEMINDSIEDMFREVFARSFGTMHLKDFKGVPTVKMETQFLSPSYCDDILRFCVQVIKLGTSSMTLEITAYCGEEKRLIAHPTLVFCDLKEMKSIPFDDELRHKISKYLIDDLALNKNEDKEDLS